jgi:hypothetical protein
MLSPTKEQRPRKRPSPTDENVQPKNYSPAKLLASPIQSVKKWLSPTSYLDDDEDSVHSKKARKDEGHNGFITSSPNIPKKVPAKGQKDVDPNVLSPIKKVSRNLNAEFEAIEKTDGSQPDSSQEDSSDESKGKRKSLLSTLFSPFYTLLVPTKASPGGRDSLRSSSERNSPVAKNGTLFKVCCLHLRIVF